MKEKRRKTVTEIHLLKRPFRRKYLVDLPLQTKLITFFVFLSLGNLAIFLYLIRLTIRYFQDELPLIAGSNPNAVITTLSDSGHWLIQAYLVSAIASFVYSVGIGILFSHSIAGPLFATRRFLKALINDESPQPLRLRKSDFMTDFAEDLNTLVKKYRPELYPKPQAAEPSATPPENPS